MLAERCALIERTCKLTLIAVLALMATAAMAEAFAETLIVQGSTTFSRRLMEPYKSVIEADSKHELTVIPNKSMPGLIALMEGRAHMAMISASLASRTAVAIMWARRSFSKIPVTSNPVGCVPTSSRWKKSPGPGCLVPLRSITMSLPA